ncbi:MAG TPA: protein translocase subunit SecD [Candidatus Binatia bacterium]|jgi:preprotein translocase subunit SecD|nr:protein translocase subunit SecD [Candidatus Binatia bacterium]
MRRGVTVRLALFIVATLLALVYLTPTFISNLPSWWSSILPTDRIHLGLDLQGGSHLVLEVKVDKAIENNVERSKTDLINMLRDRGISGVSVDRVQSTQLQVKVPAASVERVRGLVKSDFPNLTVVNTQTSGGTTEFFLTLSKEEIRALRDYAVDQSLETIRNRIDQFGVSEPIIQRQGQQDILIQLPGIQDPERAKEIIGKTALLEFKLVDDNVNVEEALRNGPPPGRQILYGYGGKGEGGVGAEKTAYVLEARTLMTGEYITDARVRPSSQLQGPYVELVLNSTGARLFEQITGANVKRRLAIVLDNRVYSAPVIQERIGGGRASITGSFDIKEARDLAIVLRAGALPAPVEIVEERTVGPSLGQDSIRQGITSFIVGGALVIVFMTAYYKGAGLVAVVAVIFNVFYMLAILAGFQAVLTLPGIAGIVLTVGMAVDANVLINERIREELRAGRTVRSAIEAGYQNALPAILDSNITTFLSGVILFQFGTGPIKGFAVTLCVGILTTVITAVYLTRTYYDFRISARKLERISV